MDSLTLKDIQDIVKNMQDVGNNKPRCNGCWEVTENDTYNCYGLCYCSECWRKTKPFFEWIELDCEIDKIESIYA